MPTRCRAGSRLPEPHHALRGRRRQPLEIGIGGVERLARRRALAARPCHDERLDGRPSPAGRLAKDQDRVGPVAAHQPVHHLDRHRRKATPAPRSSPRTCRPWRNRRARPRRACPPGAAPRSCAGRRVVARRCAAPTSSRDLRQHAADFRLRLGLGGGEQALLNHFGRLEQEIAKQPRRDVGAQPDLLGQHAVFLGPVDQRGEARPRTAAPGDSPRRCARPRDRRGGPARRSPARRCRRGRRSRADAPGSWSWRCRRDRLRRAGATAPAPGRRPRCRRPWRAGAPLRPAHCSTGARRWASSARALVSISAIRRPNTSSNRRTWSSLNWLAPFRKSDVMRLRVRRAARPSRVWMHFLQARGSARRRRPLLESCRIDGRIGRAPSARTRNSARNSERKGLANS